MYVGEETNPFKNRKSEWKALYTYPAPHPAQISLMSSIILNLNQLIFFIGTFARQFYFSGSKFERARTEYTEMYPECRQEHRNYSL